MIPQRTHPADKSATLPKREGEEVGARFITPLRSYLFLLPFREDPSEAGRWVLSLKTPAGKITQPRTHFRVAFKQAQMAAVLISKTSSADGRRAAIAR